MSETVEIDAEALGKAWGLLWASVVVFFGISARFGWGERWEALLEDLYPGFNQHLRGLVVGGGLALVDGYVDAYLLGRLYNRFASDS